MSRYVGGRSAPAGRRQTGQSLVEFALVAPLMLALLGASIDVARLYQAWIAIEAATRDAAEFAASRASSADEALAQARQIVCAQAAGLPGYLAAAPPQACSQPVVEIAEFGRTTTGVGASEAYPLATVRVRTALPFQTLFAYPLISGGGWTIVSAQSYTVVQNR